MQSNDDAFPESVDAVIERAMRLHQSGRLAEAEQAYREAIRRRPNVVQILHPFAVLLAQLGKLDEAADMLKRGLQQAPASADAHYDLGKILRSLGRVDESAAAYRRAIDLAPDHFEAHNNLANLLRDRGELDEAIVLFQRAIVLAPRDFVAQSNLGVALKARGDVDAAVAAYRVALSLRPGAAAVRSNLLLGLHYLPGIDVERIAAEHQTWDRLHGRPLTPTPASEQGGRHDRLRVGYVSADFRDHPVGRFLLPLLAHHDRGRVEIHAYSQGDRADAMTRQLQSHVDHWRPIGLMSDADADAQIRRDQIDILIDLSGHTGNNRLTLFARKPAPVQVSFLGYPNKTGLRAMDYRLTDIHADPLEADEGDGPERLVRLESCAWCFAPIDRPPLPERNGPVTFGCFNHFAKVSEAMLKVWARIVASSPDARLLLKAAALGSPGVRQRVLAVLEASGLGASRVRLLGHEPGYDRHLARYGEMDIALDTFPYHGAYTTCEAMWMGVPVITLAGQTHVSRVGVSLLNNVGLAEFVARSTGEYVDIALALARDVAHLRGLQSSLRDRIERSPLGDARGYAANIESKLLEIWASHAGR